MKIAYQGVPGAFSEEAAIAMLGEATPRVAVARFDDVFAAVRDGSATRGIVPIENTLAGSVHAVYDLLAQHDVRIVGETNVRISHVLVGVLGGTIGELRRVRSHPVALAQCERFFRAHPTIEPVASYNTAAAIAEVIERGSRDEAAIGSRRAAERYGGTILAEALEDDPENWTRFLLLSRKDEPVSGLTKTALMFTLPHRPGSLAAALAVLAAHGLDLTRIESRPLKGRPFEYAFYADVVADDPDRLAKALGALNRDTATLKVFGTYAAKSAK
jgi:prephenate dehydratase